MQEQPTPRAERPAFPPPPAGDLEQALSKGVETLLKQDISGTGSLSSVMSVIRTMIQRLKALDLRTYPLLRLYGGGDSSHPINVTMLALLIGIAMRRSEIQLYRLGQAALLHDVGKYRLDPRLVNKTEPLASAERRVLERHVEFGIDALLGHRASALGLEAEVIAAIRAHHERWDGGGYPDGLKRQRIPLAARILAVADAYETMITDRPYRPRRLPGEAYREILALSGEAFDPQVIEAFTQVIAPYPNRTLLQLDNGQVAYVVRQGRSPEFPIVQLGMGKGVLDLGQPGSPRILKLLLPRMHPRLAVELPTRIALPGIAGLQPGQIKDVSLGGAKIASPQGLTVGSRILLALDTAENEPVWLPGVVTSCSPQPNDHVHMGVRFLPLSPAAKQKLNALLKAG